MTNGTIHNKDGFLNRIAERLGRNRRSAGVTVPDYTYQPQHRVYQGYTQDELVGVLKDHCRNIHTELIETDVIGLHDALYEQASRFGGGPVIIPKDDRFKEYGLSGLLTDKWPNEGIKVWEWNAAAGEENIQRAEQANIGVTFSEITLAESGTVVLFSSKDKGRSVSLLPTTYIAIVPKSTIVPRMTQASAIIKQKVADGDVIPSCINYVTGPSNSADIEMDLVVGVHGPVKAAYIVVADR
ncbi:LutC/YkgG family protein [Bacillus haynesii]|uniref:Lactate utilization protein C n=1 Tax=Bacillus haynesii TaxID=1925021 RepID=A0AA90ESL4_9BACI|nr:lactate utilization protein C [Bacillus haynesii]MCY7791566.1 lactate utilization protein C [Bacillus haynesii]MCY8046876.1 lactate utilization protein C [Bacillus haynesii]MCY8079679.1 lactate utilization protein C [Bacillus haynesii]MCY8383129.1 lactate utilization protein C [Bacillus haynesii]MCY8587775.1 lactate utilization protein C [Bacillus haynesii]